MRQGAKPDPVAQSQDIGGEMVEVYAKKNSDPKTCRENSRGKALDLNFVKIRGQSSET
jgi:hypothetical protein